MKNSTSIEIVTPSDLREIVREVIVEEVTKLIPQKSTGQKYYTRKEAAKRARITMPTLDKYIQEGKIKAHRLGRRVLFSEEDIKNAIEEMPFIKYKRS
jgi:excisionase family DNA binding protein